MTEKPVNQGGGQEGSAPTEFELRRAEPGQLREGAQYYELTREPLEKGESPHYELFWWDGENVYSERFFARGISKPKRNPSNEGEATNLGEVQALIYEKIQEKCLWREIPFAEIVRDIPVVRGDDGSLAIEERTGLVKGDFPEEGGSFLARVDVGGEVPDVSAKPAEPAEDETETHLTQQPMQLELDKGELRLSSALERAQKNLEAARDMKARKAGDENTFLVKLFEGEVEKAETALKDYRDKKHATAAGDVQEPESAQAGHGVSQPEGPASQPSDSKGETPGARLKKIVGGPRVPVKKKPDIEIPPEAEIPGTEGITDSDWAGEEHATKPEIPERLRKAQGIFGGKSGRASGQEIAAKSGGRQEKTDRIEWDESGGERVTLTQYVRGNIHSLFSSAAEKVGEKARSVSFRRRRKAIETDEDLGNFLFKIRGKQIGRASKEGKNIPVALGSGVAVGLAKRVAKAEVLRSGLTVSEAAPGLAAGASLLRDTLTATAAAFSKDKGVIAALSARYVTEKPGSKKVEKAWGDEGEKKKGRLKKAGGAVLRGASTLGWYSKAVERHLVKSLTETKLKGGSSPEIVLNIFNEKLLELKGIDVKVGGFLADEDLLRNELRTSLSGVFSGQGEGEESDFTRSLVDTYGFLTDAKTKNAYRGLEEKLSGFSGSSSNETVANFEALRVGLEGVLYEELRAVRDADPSKFNEYVDKLSRHEWGGLRQAKYAGAIMLTGAGMAAVKAFTGVKAAELLRSLPDILPKRPPAHGVTRPRVSVGRGRVDVTKPTETPTVTPSVAPTEATVQVQGESLQIPTRPTGTPTATSYATETARPTLEDTHTPTPSPSLRPTETPTPTQAAETTMPTPEVTPIPEATPIPRPTGVVEEAQELPVDSTPQPSVQEPGIVGAEEEIIEMGEVKPDVSETAEKLAGEGVEKVATPGIGEAVSAETGAQAENFFDQFTSEGEAPWATGAKAGEQLAKEIDMGGLPESWMHGGIEVPRSGAFGNFFGHISSEVGPIDGNLAKRMAGELRDALLLDQKDPMAMARLISEPLRVASSPEQLREVLLSMNYMDAQKAAYYIYAQGLISEENVEARKILIEYFTAA